MRAINMYVYFLGHSAIRGCCDHDRRHNTSHTLNRYA